MPSITKLVRKSSQPLQQVVRRISEKNQTQQNKGIKLFEDKRMIFEHNQGPLIDGVNSPQYKGLKTEIFLVNVSKFADSFVELKNSEILEVKNFVTSRDGLILMLGYSYIRISDYFTKPINSSEFGISRIKKNSLSLSAHPVSSVLRKLMILPYKDQIICIPILH